MKSNMDKNQKKSLALALFIESVLKPDSELRQCAYSQGCFDELMELRREVLEYLYNIPNEFQQYGGTDGD
jgi:hypothetical protein